VPGANKSAGTKMLVVKKCRTNQYKKKKKKKGIRQRGNINPAASCHNTELGSTKKVGGQSVMMNLN